MSKVFGILTLVFVLSSCREKDETYKYDEPLHVEFRDLTFKDIHQGTDTLTLTLFVAHRNEFGLKPDEDDPPFHSHDYILDSRDSLVTLSSASVLPFYQMVGLSAVVKDTLELDPRGSFHPDRYRVERLLYRGKELEDTFFIARNPFHYNLTLEFVDQNGKNWEDWLDLNPLGDHFFFTIGFNGRVPPIAHSGIRMSTIHSPPFEILVFNNHEFLLKYHIVSAIFSPVLGQKEFKVRAQMSDRSLNTSQVVESPLATLNELMPH